MNNTTTSNPEEALDARLTELLADVDEAPEDPAAPQATDEDASEDDAEDEEDQSEDEPEAPAQAEAQAPSEDEEEIDDADLSPEHAKALRGLRLLHAPETVLQGLSETDAIAWWNSRKKAETAINRQIAETNKQGTSPTASSGAQGVPTAAQEHHVPSADEAAVLATIEEEFGPSARDAFERLVELRTAPLRQVVQATQQRTQAQLIEAARAKVGERFPGLMDDERWSAVQDTARRLSDDPEYANIESQHGSEAGLVALFEAAARAKGVRQVDEQAAARRRKVDAARRSGTPPVAPHRNAVAPPKNAEEALDRRIQLAEKGMTASEIRKLIG